MLYFIEQLLNGVQLGMLLFLLAAGLTLIFGIMDLVNLAHGSLYMLGAYFAATFAALTGSFVLGAILALVLFKEDLDVIELIGIILLIGIVKKNAIMMIDFALEAERNEGKSPEEAIYQACRLRFRPRARHHRHRRIIDSGAPVFRSAVRPILLDRGGGTRRSVLHRRDGCQHV